MRHAETIAPVAAAASAIGTLLCCLPIPFAMAAATASLSAVVATHRLWFLAGSVVLLGIGAVQWRNAQRACPTRRYGSSVVLGICVVIVLLVVFVPQVIATVMADWLP
ncbi:MAG: hypothetical protein H0W08_17435 [Acidobacteria bacterium]|nr:hypothetical protein [Acidobacteriota bacterium]